MTFSLNKHFPLKFHLTSYCALISGINQLPIIILENCLVCVSTFLLLPPFFFLSSMTGCFFYSISIKLSDTMPHPLSKLRIIRILEDVLPRVSSSSENHFYAFSLHCLLVVASIFVVVGSFFLLVYER